MKLDWKWILGIVLILAVIALPFAWRIFLPFNGGYSMMRGYGYGMPMMGGYGMFAPFGMWLLWLLPLGAFILVGFAVGWAAHQFTRKAS